MKRFSHRKYKEPDSYNGESTEWPDYICHFEQVSKWNGWSETEKAAQLAICLRGVAQRVLSELTEKELSSYSDLRQALTQRFCPAEREIAHRCDFRNRKRKPNETAADYGYALKRLASRAFPNFMPQMRESLTIDQFISGLGSQEIKRYVQFSHPLTLDKAVSLAVEYEAFEGAHNVRKPIDPEISSVHSLVQSRNTKQETRNDNDISALNRSMQGIQKSLETLLSIQSKSQNNKGNEGKYENSDRRKLICYNCKKEGHIRKRCPLLHDNQEEVNSPAKTQNQPESVDNHLNVEGLSQRA